MEYNITAKTQRMQNKDETSNKKSFEDYLEEFLCLIQPLDSDINQDITNSFGKTKLMFCDVMDIIEGDRVVVGTAIYKVVGIESFDNFEGNEDHMEVMIRNNE